VVSSAQLSSRAPELVGPPVSDLVIVALVVPVVLVVGIGLGMLVARRLGRLIDDDEEPGDD
jgi:hypothetical protein